ncbi:MAG: hypothetical protein H0U75_03725 [Legionella sp.]|nr:hypothetical protein [Legionella sp.]
MDYSINKISSCHNYNRGHADHHCSNLNCAHEKHIYFSCKDRACRWELLNLRPMQPKRANLMPGHQAASCTSIVMASPSRSSKSCKQSRTNWFFEYPSISAYWGSMHSPRQCSQRLIFDQHLLYKIFLFILDSPRFNFILTHSTFK